MKKFTLAVCSLVFLLSCNAQPKKSSDKSTYEVTKTDAEWQKQLTSAQYQVTVIILHGTETAFTGEIVC